MEPINMNEVGGMTVQPEVKFERSQNLGALTEALAKARKNFKPLKKNTDNPYYNSKYSDLADIMEATRDALSAENLAIIQLPVRRDKEAGVKSILSHSSNEWISAELLLPATGLAKGGGIKFDSQTVGAAITYANRFTYQALAGVAGEIDDDGNSISHDEQRTQNQTQTNRAQTRPPTTPKASLEPFKERSQSEQGSGKSEPFMRIPAVAVGPQSDDSTDAGVPNHANPAKTSENASNSVLPTQPELAAFKARATKLTKDLIAAGAKVSEGGPSVGEQLKSYLLMTAAVKDLKEISTGNWNTILTVLENKTKLEPKFIIGLIQGEQEAEV